MKYIKLFKYCLVACVIGFAVFLFYVELPSRPPASSYKQSENIQILYKKNQTHITDVRFIGTRRREFSTSYSCSDSNTSTPQADVQVLSMYERLTFDDVDGGVWKQGWDIEYDTRQWSSENKLRVFIVPHSHNDPGWMKTFEEYYKIHTKAILSNMVEKLQKNPNRKFIWAEICYLALWWESDATSEEKTAFKRLLKYGQIEIVNGGWVVNDEANTHWYSTILQLTTGHQWLLDNLEYIPKNSWSIDPFGYSSSQPYILNLAGFENSVIHRVHYRVKKELAFNKQLEFNWRQFWDGTGESDIFTHVMPFNAYDVPYSCGPDPKICCQFDFKRLSGNGIACPMGVPPERVTLENVRERGYLILDQWRKKSQLFRSNVVLFPLGDDFWFEEPSEWDDQYENYEMLIDYINRNSTLNTEVRFGTLQDYFKAVNEDSQLSDFPVLSGDFFTYSDHNQHYWSGYFTSHPFYKWMDRSLLAYVRAAETVTSQLIIKNKLTEKTSAKFRESIEYARRALSLFQHHDGITGTAKDVVREDYARKMLQAIRNCQSVIQEATFHILSKPAIKIQNDTNETIYFDIDDIWKKHNEIPSRLNIVFNQKMRSHQLVLYNALAFRRTEILTVIVSSPYVQVFDSNSNPVRSQLSPVVVDKKHLSFATDEYQLSFPVTVGSLDFSMYTVALCSVKTMRKYTSCTRVKLFNADNRDIQLPKIFSLDQETYSQSDDISFQAGKSVRALVDKNGLLKAVVSKTGEITPVKLNFVKYKNRKQTEMRSGAALRVSFTPDGPAQDLGLDQNPVVVITEGPFKSTLHALLIAPEAVEILQTVILYNNPSLTQTAVEITNTFKIAPTAHDIELAMRFSTSIDNKDVFYTDLNGMQIIRRRYFEKLPLQANFYPMAAAAYLEDERTRLTVLTSAPLGVAALTPGQIEVMQDRRLSKDDDVETNSDVLENLRTQLTFKLIVESATNQCQGERDHRFDGQLSLGAHVSQQMLLQPLVVMHSKSQTSSFHVSTPDTNMGYFGAGADIVLAGFHSHVSTKDEDDNINLGIGMTIHRAPLDSCYGTKDIETWYPVSNGQVNVSTLAGVPAARVRDASLTFIQARRSQRGGDDGLMSLCPSRVRSVFLQPY